MLVDMSISMHMANLYNNSYTSGHIPIIVVKLNFASFIKLVVVNLDFDSSNKLYKLHKLVPSYIQNH